MVTTATDVIKTYNTNLSQDMPIMMTRAFYCASYTFDRIEWTKVAGKSRKSKNLSSLGVYFVIDQMIKNSPILKLGKLKQKHGRRGKEKEETANPRELPWRKEKESQ